MIYLKDLYLIMKEVSLGECQRINKSDEDGSMEAWYKGNAIEESGKKYDILIKLSTKEPAFVYKVMNEKGHRSFKEWYSLRQTWTYAYIRDENNFREVVEHRNLKKLTWYVCIGASIGTMVLGTLKLFFAPSLYRAFLVFAGALLFREAKIRKSSMCYGDLEDSEEMRGVQNV